MKKKIKEYFSNLKETKFISAAISLILTIKISWAWDWNNNFFTILILILGFVGLLVVLFFTIDCILQLAIEFPTFRGVIIGFIVGTYFFYTPKYQLYKIGPEDEYIKATVDRYVEIDGYDYIIEDEIEGNNNYINLQSFVEYATLDKIDNNEICKISNKMILQDNKYFYVCDDGFDKEFNIEDVNIINLKDEN